jgi:serine/threonine protein kinase/Flp pilus assembly protein TadD
MTIAPGTKLGRYEIRSKIGAGGMGEVYLAQDMKLDRKVALKILPVDVAAHEGRMRRFVQEAKSASALNHPNIITIYEIDEIDSGHFMAMEFIDGETLRDHMRKAPLKLNEALDVAVQIASALSAAHAAGIVHRDLKPENVILRRDGLVKLLDFGIAKLCEPGSSDSVDHEAPTRVAVNTEPGVVMGTVIYMSPEQARGAPIDARTDIFSLGVLIYEMIAGCLPFKGSSTNEIVASLLDDKEPPPLARYAREVPIELERIVSKSLRKERDERYQTSRDLLIDLKNLKEELEFERKRERSLSPDSEGATPRARFAEYETLIEPVARPTVAESKWTVAIKAKRLSIAVAVLLVVAGIAAYFYFHSASSGTINSVAVLPFINVSKDQNTEYLSDGISESLINHLSQLPQLKVIARSSTFMYKGKEVDPQEAARALGVQAIVTGHVLQRGDDLQISVELVRASDKTQMWGEQYNRKAADLQTVQSEIARTISDKLRLRLSGAQEEQLARRATVNPQAYQLYLNGLFYARKGGLENQKKGLDYYQQAVTLDPNFALAYAMMVPLYSNLYIVTTSGELTAKEARSKSKDVAQKALDLDDTLAEAHAAMGLAKQWEWDWSGCESELKRALELNPNLAGARNNYGNLLSVLGRSAESLEQYRRAQELDPLRAFVFKSNAVGTLLRARRYDEAIKMAQEVTNVEPNFPNAHAWLGELYAATGNYAESIKEFQRTVDIDGPIPTNLCYMGYAYGLAGRRDDALAILNKLKTTDKYVSPTDLSIVYIGLGDKEGAFQTLERAYNERDPELRALKTEPYFDPLRSDSRFADLIKRVGFPA